MEKAPVSKTHLLQEWNGVYALLAAANLVSEYKIISEVSALN